LLYPAFAQLLRRSICRMLVLHAPGPP